MTVGVGLGGSLVDEFAADPVAGLKDAARSEDIARDGIRSLG